MSSSIALGSVGQERSCSLSLDRIAGLAGLAFAVVVGLVNVFVGSLQPPATNAGASEIIAFVTENKTALSVAFAAIPAGVFLLFAFGASAYPRLAASSPEAAFWARFGLIGVVLVEVMFLIRTLSEVVLVANIDRLGSEPAIVETLWQMQGAAMTANGLALAVTLTGLARAARLANLIPGWQELMAYGGAILFVIGSVAVVPTLEGSAIELVGLFAFLIWLAWLAITSVRLLREGESLA